MLDAASWVRSSSEENFSDRGYFSQTSASITNLSHGLLVQYTSLYVLLLKVFYIGLQIAHLKKCSSIAVSFEGVKLGRGGKLSWILVCKRMKNKQNLFVFWVDEMGMKSPYT